MSRLRFNNISSFGMTNPITFADDSTTTGTFGSDPGFPDIASGDYVAIPVAPDTTNEEIVWLEGPFTSGDTAPTTFLRGQEGSTAVAHAAATWVHGSTVFDFIPNLIGDGSPEGAVAAELGQFYTDGSGYDGSMGSTTGLFMFGRSTPDGVAATTSSDSAPTLPLTVVTGVNDEFVYTPISTDTPETFTVAAGVYATLDDVIAAMAAALGSSAERFDTIATPSNNGTNIVVTINVVGIAHNGDSVGEGANDVIVAMGFLENPNEFFGGVDTNTGWFQLAGDLPIGFGTQTPGLSWDYGSGATRLLAQLVNEGQVAITDVAALLGSGSGIYYFTNGVDGEQSVQINLGGHSFNFGPDGSATIPGLFTIGGIPGGGGVSFSKGSGSPVGSVSANAEGDIYIDESTPGVWQATGTSTSDWVQLGVGGGAGVPIGSQALTQSTQTATLSFSSEPITWLELDGSFGPAAVFAASVTGDSFPRILVDNEGDIYASDGTVDPTASTPIFSANGGSTTIFGSSAVELETNDATVDPILLNGIFWWVSPSNPIGVVTPTQEGDVCVVLTGPGFFQATSAGDDTAWIQIGGVLPTADPHVANSLWNNAGIVTVSAG